MTIDYKALYNARGAELVDMTAERDALRARLEELDFKHRAHEACVPEFVVYSGKIEYDGSRNCKFSDVFADYLEALKCYESMSGMPWRELCVKQRHYYATVLSN